MLAALAAVVITGRLNTAEPTAGVAMEMDAVAAVVMGGTSLAGGKGSIVGQSLVPFSWVFCGMV